MQKFKDLIAKCGCNGKYTHTINNIAYDISDEIYNDFIKTYTNVILKNNKINISEKHKGYGPILIELNNPVKKKVTDIVEKYIIK